MKLKTLTVAAIMCLPMFTQAADIDAGKAKTGMCVGCHGVNGKDSIPMYPNLAGQNAAYLESAIKAYKKKDRKGGQAAIMYGMVAALTDEDIKNIAAYYASLK